MLAASFVANIPNVYYLWTHAARHQQQAVVEKRLPATMCYSTIVRTDNNTKIFFYLF